MAKDNRGGKRSGEGLGEQFRQTANEARKKIRKKEAQIFRRCALRGLFNLGNFGFQLNSTNVNIKGLDTHPKEFKYKKYMDEEAAKRLYKKRDEVKID